MLQNARVIAFTVFELLRVNQQVEGIPPPPTQIKVKDIKNLFRLRKEQNDAAAKGVRNLFRLKKKLKELKI